MPVDVIIGLQWGDEGKGKIVDIMAPGYQVIARYQGGPNAGHTLVINKKKFVLHTLPSGVVHPHIINILGSGMVIDPVILREEIEQVKKENISLDGKLKISGNAHLILPTHRMLDKFYEELKGASKVGSTLKGIGPAYQDKYGRNGLKAFELKGKNFREKYDKLTAWHRSILGYYECDEPDYEKRWLEAAEFMSTLEITDTEIYINNELKKGSFILAEGAQGTMLDINYGTYPYVTSSDTISSGACIGLGIPPSSIRDVLGVFKAYATRVGEGPFVTEQLNHEGEKLRQIGKEYGSTTGRPRRCGWLDLVALNYAISINGVNKLAITKSDVLTGFDQINVCTEYMDENGNHAELSDLSYGKKVFPHYISFPCWEEPVSDTASYDQLPGNFKKYLEFLQEKIGLNISIISLGPDRNETIVLN